MKALTLTQPWASLVALGAKRIETRSWATVYRGPLAIHAASGLGPVGGKKGLAALADTETFFRVFVAAGMTTRSSTLESLVAQFPLGAIIAVCNVLDCVPAQHPNIVSEPGKPWFTAARKGVGQHYYEVPPPSDSNEYAFGNYSAGRFAWLLADVQALPEPVPCKGALGLWTPDMATMDAVSRQVQHAEG